MKKAGRAAAELCGAVIGAGFASGREVASFFARFGGWSWLGVAAAVVVLGGVCLLLMRHPGEGGMPLHWRGSWLACLWRGMFVSLMLATGGAMMAGGGEIAALMLPMHGARILGLAGTLALAWWLAGKENAGLATVSKGLIGCLLAVVLVGLFLPVRETASLRPAGNIWQSLAQGLCYGGFNAALAAPVISLTGAELSPREQRRCAAVFTVVLAVLLTCGNAVLLRHAALQEAQLPFVMLLSGWGRAGYVLGGAALYLAALTTLVACLRGLRLLLPRHMGAVAAGVALLSLSGLEGMVGVVYPVLGGGCFLLLAAAWLLIGTKT